MDGRSGDVYSEGILLQKSKIERPGKSREGRSLDFIVLLRPLQRRYEAPWSFLYETMWSPISPRAKGISILKNFGRRPKEGQTLTWRWSAPLEPDRLKLVI